MYQFDKLVHFGIFYILSLLFCRVAFLVKQNSKLLWLVALLCSVYGVAMEFVQQNYIANRSFDIFDIVADACGSYAIFIFRFFKFTSNFKPKSILLL
ncbi:MAG: VanZ family protein [Chitinophagaceae bacterium]